MTGRLEYLGERPDLAAVYKLLGNAMFIGLWAVMADILTLAKALIITHIFFCDTCSDL